jgi:hypothetical protein
MNNPNKKIVTKISPDILDTIGKTFKFNHGKGISEWLKNSLDNYLRLYELGQEKDFGNWACFINLIDTKSQKYGPSLAVIDFGGTSFNEIEKFFLHWGDTKAASLGGIVNQTGLTGGHGNGGKFYMREMWKDGARFLSWKKGKCTSLLVNQALDGYTGEWEYQNEDFSWKDATEFALNEGESLGGSEWLTNYLQENLPNIFKDLENYDRGITIIVGKRAKQLYNTNDVVKGGKWYPQLLVDSIRSANQAKRPLNELRISLFINGKITIEQLSGEEIPLDDSWESLEIELPDNLFEGSDLDYQNKYLGKLILKKSSQQLTGRFKQYNNLSCIDTNGNPIGFYSFSELPLPGFSSLYSFLLGDLELNFDLFSQFISNDREKLINSPTIQTLLDWVSDKIWNSVNKFEENLKQEKKKEELELADVLNNALNLHARKFLKELEALIMVDYISSPDGGGYGEEGEGKKHKGNKELKSKTPRNFGSGGEEGDGGERDTEGDNKQKRKPKFPEVLLSGFHEDPSRDDNSSKYLTERHPPIHQDDIDQQYNLWWINTNHPYAKKALEKGGSKGVAFKNYHLFLFIQVVQIESMRILQRRQSELGLDVLENHLSDITNKFLGDLPIDLADRLVS